VTQTLNRAPALGNIAIGAVSFIGLITFCLPFIVSGLAAHSMAGSTRTVDASLLLAIVVTGALTIAVGELVRAPCAGNLTRSIALLGALVAIDATLRLVPSFLGASPIFALIILVGFVFGSRFGFAMGALTLMLSAAITAGVGPWLPFQMLCAGWIGLAAGWLPHYRAGRVELVTLTLFGFGSGFGYGALMNLYSWPFAAPGASANLGLYWAPSLSFSESVERYATYYLATSLVHDATRAVATAGILLVAGPQVIRLLRRFLSRTAWIASG